MSNQIKVGVIVVALAATAFLLYRNLTGKSDSGVDLSEPSYWVCRNEGCGRDFEVPLSVLAKKQKSNDTSPMTCSHCGSAKVTRANRCPSCAKNIEFVGHGELPEICPHCKTKIGEASQHDSRGAKGKSSSGRR